ncbi:efflux transporter periplasmic adaptor subunit [Bacterioplanes sanyensis]|uniref:Efflux transporter periplasmic adaptor subunit n=1 Tax=Bacterioplanes sanyensis TaxID=1249553 RepID=A0A222FL27_9GAMM|nr:efflux RND transporter periplasmic adaptor subunit [Bacterioplanes sanyensis]ASP39081.1 efflux transporter periplasmic adaptor subunit [Bacterioplanes sanyensis]
MKSPTKSMIVLLLASLLLAACSSEPAEPQASAAPLQPIDVAHVVRADIIDWSQFTTRLQAPQTVEVRPRVSGVIESIEFVEGAEVKQGDLLVKLDPRPYAAEVDRLTAQRDAALAALKQAQLEERRSTRLRASNAMAAEQADARVFQAQQRQAELAAMEAALQAAQLNLEFTDIRSPLNGRVSNAFIQPGNTVNANASVLTQLVSTEQVHAYFDIDERSWNAQFSDVTAATQLAVYLQLTGENDYQHMGMLDFIDNRVNFNTGTLRVRATFDVADNKLRPGAFARVRIAPQQKISSVLVPETAIGTDLKNRFVLAVNAENTLEYRQVTLGPRIGTLRVIETGLNGDDRIAVNGPARVGPGMPIEPRDVTIDTSALAQVLPETRISSELEQSVAQAR